MSTPADWSADDFAARLRDRLRSAEPAQTEVPPEQQQLRQAAALLTSFDPGSLHPAGAAPTGTGFQLVDDCTARAGQARTAWALRSDVRATALQSFAGPEEARLALETNIGSAPRHAAERLALRYLRGDPPVLENLDVESLLHAREAVSWLSLVPGVPGLPEAEEIERLLDHRRLVEPLHSLLRHGFAGRARELDVLRRHVGLLPARHWRARMADAGRAVNGWLGRANGELPLVVTGPGGVGKSTLMARFLLDHVDRPGGRVPWVHVDFESATLRIQEPVSLVAEMARQLAAQYPDEAPALDDLRSSARSQSRLQRQQFEELDELEDVVTTRASLGREAKYRYHTQTRDEDAQAAHTLGRTLRRAVARHPAATGEEPPLIVALDSFEEAQYRASPILDRMWAMFTALRDAYPQTRVVVAGRAPVGHPAAPAEEVPTLTLGDLDEAAAVHLLRTLGVTDPVARALVERIGGNPLSLQLAADVAVRMQHTGDDGDWVRTVPARRRRLFGAVDDMLIQGVLYYRLLSHITNPDVRRLAHPGLVLRRITPAIIEQVLAPVCGVDVSRPGRADELFEELARELDLVDRTAPDVLRHRADVRRVMVRLVAEDRAEATRELERRAVAFYAASRRPEDRVEEVYHRLRLGQGAQEIEARWLSELAPLLDGVADELPARSAKLLARLQRSMPAEATAQDDQADWEHRTADEAENLLTQGYAAEALTLLSARRPWTTGSPLHAVRVEALLRTGDLAQARQAVADALAEPGIEENGDAYLELLLLSARIAAESGDVEWADDDLALAERTATRMGRDLDALGALLQRTRLPDSADAGDHHQHDLVTELAHRVEAMPEEILAGQTSLVRAVAAAVGDRVPAVLARALDLVGLPAHSPPARTALARAIADTAHDQPAVVDVISRTADPLAERPPEPNAGEVERLLHDAEQRGLLDELARELLTLRDDTGSLRAGIAAAMSADLPPVVREPPGSPPAP
ncbi:ATP-binding protein [Jiangella aurantiaca]|uniref:ATP-binding protein n=1 Tax=Jiangella aurantiaca TaxID=2530373 RepID=A0A4V2YRB5_9ACTN|nr:AAA family ATPase [Jiangella aurantiaca]TDD65477.1 ATP-binding protein [Jiangella aurantiaca]